MPVAVGTVTSAAPTTFVRVRTWRVVFRGPVSDEVLASLPPDHMLYVSGHTVGSHLRSSTLWVRAADAPSARQAVLDALSTPGDVLPPELLPYSVLIEVPPEDVSALEDALSARRRETGGIGGLIVPAPSEGDDELQREELHLDVDTDSAEAAADLGIEDYRELRREAGLQERDPTGIRVYPPWPGEQRRHRVLLGRARELLRQGAPGPAVVVAQSAVEVLVDGVIGQRLQARDVGGFLRAHIMGMIRTYTLNDDKTQALWLELTGDRINQLGPLWLRYRNHLNRRHEFVHRGADVSDTDAAESLEVVNAMIEHIESLPPAVA